MTAAAATNYTMLLLQPSCLFLEKIFYFILGYSLLTNNVMSVLSEERRDSAIHIHASILPSPTPFQAGT